MKFNLLWRYVLAQALDIAIILLCGWLIITGFFVAKFDLAFFARFLLGTLSALYWVFLYTVIIPFYWNGQTLMKKVFKVGVKFNVKMTFKKLFIANAAFQHGLPVMSWGASVLINLGLMIFTKKHKSLEERFTNCEYYVLTKDNEYINLTSKTEQELLKKNNKKKRLHPRKRR